MTFIIYCDESADKGPKYSDFFGGCIVNSKNVNDITKALEKKKKELNLYGEIKWTKVTDNYLEKYIEMMDVFFSFIKDGMIKVRIMFRRSDELIEKSTQNSIEDKYFKLYYQFLKHSFGLMSIPKQYEPAKIIVFLDSLPDKKGRRDEFKEYLHNMPNTKAFNDVDIEIRSRDIIEVDSKDHVLLQCTDIILGAMNFKLNQYNKFIPEGSSRRGKRTIAKEKLYKHIQRNISEIHPSFNTGVSTGFRGYKNPHWDSPYEHWLFVSSEIESD